MVFLATRGRPKVSKAKTKIDSKATEVKLTAAEARQRVAELEAELEHEQELVWCYMCDKKKRRDHFYMSTDPLSTSQLTPCCKECARKLALRVDAQGYEHEPTKASVTAACMALNKPMLDSVWDASIAESTNENLINKKSNVWTSYIKNISMINYTGYTFKDSDMFKTKQLYEDEKTVADVIKGKEDQDTYSDFLKNKADVIRLLSYDPFEYEAISDQPSMYSRLLGLLDSDENGNDDMLRTASCISIVRNFLQQDKLDRAIAAMQGDVSQTQNNSATIKSMQDSKAKLVSQIKDLAAESCISLKNSKNAKKGENTWSGKLKKLRELNLRESNVNGFDIQTCRGMQQVQEASDASIMKQLALDESEWSDMVAQMRERIVALQKEKEQYKEINRILLQENLDLKDFMEDEGISLKKECKDLKSLYSVFSSEEDISSEEVDLNNADSG